MYTKCLFCHSDLGANDVIERFPIGRRLAFDEAKGRLWVVCSSCSRWNLTPVEERWEAIEDCERRFRATHLRLSTDHIGLAKLSEGLELVRVGKPQRPEMAAWRYGAKFRARRIRALVTQGVSYGALAALAVVSPVQVFQLATSFVNPRRRRRPVLSLDFRVVGRFPNGDGSDTSIRAHHAARVVLLPAARGEEWGLRFRHGSFGVPRGFNWGVNPFLRETDIRGEAARLLIPHILPVINYAGARDTDVKEALGFLDKYQSASTLFNHAAGIAARIGRPDDEGHGELAKLPPEHRLALEMVANEETERRALEGELKLLEDAWREAEEIAAISDNLLLPKSVTTIFARMKAWKADR